MKPGLLQLWGVVSISTLWWQSMSADVLPPPTDVAPPPETVAALSLGVLVMVGCLVAGIVVAAVLVIRALKRKNTVK